jgi:chlorobactene glucosyltransferase
MEIIWYLAVLLVQVLLGRRSWRQYQKLPRLRASPFPAAYWPRVSIVVPARDEERHLAPLLASLRALDYPDYEIIVVDDNSADGTASLAAAARVRVQTGAPLPAGWAGKAFACHQGVAATDGEWILFTDADTVHAPTSLRAAIAYSRREDLDVLSLVPGQECVTFFERLLLPLAFSVVFAGSSTRRVCRDGMAPGRDRPLVSGAYILCRRDLYERTGGYAAIGDSIIEDAMLIDVLVREQHRYRLCRAEHLVRVRLYGCFAELWAGFRKNTARYALHDLLPLLRMAVYSVVLGGLPRLAHGALRAGRRALLALTLLNYVTGVVCLVPWYRRFGVRGGYAALYPVGVGVLALISADSAWRTVSRRGVSWKGRNYR